MFVNKHLRGHTVWISSLSILPSGDIVSGSWDKTIRIWGRDIDDINGLYVCKQTLTGHTVCIATLSILSSGDIVSGSWNKTIRVWSNISFQKWVARRSVLYIIVSLSRKRKQ